MEMFGATGGASMTCRIGFIVLANIDKHHDRHITTQTHTLTSITSFAHAPYCSSYKFDFRVRVVETLNATCATIFSAELARR